MRFKIKSLRFTNQLLIGSVIIVGILSVVERAEAQRVTEILDHAPVVVDGKLLSFVDGRTGNRYVSVGNKDGETELVKVGKEYRYPSGVLKEVENYTVWRETENGLELREVGTVRVGDRLDVEPGEHFYWAGSIYLRSEDMTTRPVLEDGGVGFGGWRCKLFGCDQN